MVNPMDGRKAVSCVPQKTDFPCPTCGKGRMALEIIPSYSTRLGGIALIVEDARVSKCSSCGETSVSATELKRWRVLQQSATK